MTVRPALPPTLVKRARWLAEYGVLAALRTFVAHLPPAVARATAQRLGRAYVRLHGPRTEVGMINLRLAFPDWSPAQHRDVLAASAGNFLCGLAEAALLAGPYRDEVLDGVRIEGEEHLAAVRAASLGGGGLFLTAHFGAWELTGAVLTRLGVQLAVVHHPIENPWLARLVDSSRHAAGLVTIEMGGRGAGVFRAVRRGAMVVMLMDQNAGRDEGVFSPFFGELASTRIGPLAIAMRRPIGVLPAFVFREGTAGQHVIRILPPLEVESGEPGVPGDGRDGGALLRNVGRMNAAIEAVIREAPDQWLWAHRRFRTRPDGAPRIYPSRRGRPSRNRRQR